VGEGKRQNSIKQPQQTTRFEPRLLNTTNKLFQKDHPKKIKPSPPEKWFRLWTLERDLSPRNHWSLDLLHGFVQDSGDTRSTSQASHSYDLVHQNLLNQDESRNSTKNTSKPKAKKTPKLSPFSLESERGIKGKRTTRGSCIHPQQIPKTTTSKSLQENHQRKGSENHQKEKLGRTQTSPEEPRRIIYTYHEGSYKV
jgi:hypothetical protein